MKRGILTLMFGLTALSSATAQNVSNPEGAAPAIPNVALVYYDVSGPNDLKIRSSINNARPVDPADGKPHDGLTNYKFGWGWPIDGTGKCHLDEAKVEFRATVTLPLLTNYAELPVDLQKKWDRYQSALKDHEFGHVELAWAQKDNLLAVIQGATCDTANKAANEFVRQIVDMQKKYDIRTKGGISKTSSFP